MELDTIEVKSKRSLRTLCSEVLVLLVSAFILSLAFPGFMTSNGFGWIAFIALIPVFMVIKNTTFKCVWFYGFIYGMCYYFFFNYWLKGFHPLAILIAPIIKGGEMMLLFLALKAAIAFFPKKGYLLQPVIWMAYAYLAESWFAGYPYGNIGYAIYRYRVLVQIVDITGVWGVLFMMVLPQAFIGGALMDKINSDDFSLRKYFKKELVFEIIYAVLLLVVIIYGVFRLSYWTDREPDKNWRVATVQHNHDSWKGGFSTYRINFNNLRRYTYEALSSDPDIVVWSETAFVPSVSWHTNYSYKEGSEWDDIANLTKEFVAFGESLPVPLLTGNPKGVIGDESLPPYNEEGELNRKDYNSVILFNEGEIVDEYCKQHLVPFTEHFPYEKQMPWLYNLLLANDYNWWEKGDEPSVFEIDGIKFSTPICYEDAFGYLNAEFVANGADVIMNMTNDNWSKKDSAEWQHAAIATFRSIETRKSMVRGTNSGVTCLITPDGKIHDPMKTFTMGWNVYDVPVYTHENYDNTFFVKCYDLFAYIAIYTSIAFLSIGAIYKIICVVRKRKNK